MPHTENLLLASLSPSDIALFLPHLKLVQVKQHQVSSRPAINTDDVFFQDFDRFLGGSSIGWPVDGSCNGRVRRSCFSYGGARWQAGDEPWNYPVTLRGGLIG